MTRHTMSVAERQIVTANGAGHARGGDGSPAQLEIMSAQSIADRFGVPAAVVSAAFASGELRSFQPALWISVARCADRPDVERWLAARGARLSSPPNRTAPAIVPARPPSSPPAIPPLPTAADICTAAIKAAEGAAEELAQEREQALDGAARQLGVDPAPMRRLAQELEHGRDPAPMAVAARQLGLDTAELEANAGALPARRAATTPEKHDQALAAIATQLGLDPAKVQANASALARGRGGSRR